MISPSNLEKTEQVFKSLWATMERASAQSMKPRTKGMELRAYHQITEVKNRVGRISNPLSRKWFEEKWGLHFLVSEKFLEGTFPSVFGVKNG